MQTTTIRRRTLQGVAGLLLAGLAGGQPALAADFAIERAVWRADLDRLVFSGSGEAGETVHVTNAADGSVTVGDAAVGDAGWRVVQRAPAAIPCRIAATQSDGARLEADVRNAPIDCEPGGQPARAFVIERAVWQADIGRLAVRGDATVGETVTVANAHRSDVVLGGNRVQANGWWVGIHDLVAIPCRVVATLGDGQALEADVLDAPADCVAGPVVVDPPDAPAVSINSTAQNAADSGVDPYLVGPVDEEPFAGNSSHTVLAINDLGMHCGDLDTRVSSILPPFQVLLAQVIERGGEPRILDPTEAELVYSAASNPNDPILSDPGAFRGLADNGEVFKTNFWEIASSAYAPFYPPGILDRFYDTANPDANADMGLPVPNVAELYIGQDGQIGSGDEQLVAAQHAMPGMTAPYLGNDALAAHEYYEDKPFFIDFPFGYVAEDLKWFEAAGIPFAAFDDFGRENPYPLVRVQARVGGDTVATTDTVLPISGEASCKNCHSADVDVTDETPHAGSALAPLAVVATQLDDPAIGEVPVEVSIEYATDLNILRLHDIKHGTALEAEQPVVCQRCHYTPALDLAQIGPKGPENDPAGANGRDQLKQGTMSNVMHSHHGATGLFPDIPAPIQLADGTIVNQTERVAALGQNCYSCHPGKHTQCLRGAMFNGGMLCTDCHGDLAQVGDDFSKDVSPDNVGGFRLTGNFYTDPQQPRVPWANEPGCGSCHTGDANHNMAGQAGVVVNTVDANGVADGIRLRQAYLSDDARATPIVPLNKRFAEPVVPASYNGTPNNGAGNPQLYRVSTGHGGVMCEGCHGATHAEWPNANPNANDNVTARQLQGHTGTLIECSTCHITRDLPDDTQGGPHGMHLVDDRRFWKEGHKDLAKRENRRPGGGTCGSCHGADHKGTVLSRAPVDRTWNVESRDRTVLAGEPVGCDVCHSLAKSFER